MANPEAIVSRTIRLEPALERAPDEMLRAEGGLWVTLDGERRARLDPADPRSAGFAQVLDGLRKLNFPVYLEVDPATSAVTRLLIPLVTRVEGMRPSDDDDFDLELAASHARHVLRRDQPNFAELERELRAALEARKTVVVTEDEAHRIISVQAFEPDPERPLPPFPEPRPWPVLPWPWRIIWRLLYPIWIWPWWPWWWFWWFRCISPSRAQQVFDAMAATSCAPLTVPAPCIPFLYPDDGCWARAHEMCRLMINMGLLPAKVWIRASTRLHVNTRNNPACFVEWGWHVAPTLCVRGSWFPLTRRMVIDPSLFTTPVTKATWKGVQGDPNATLTDTAWTQYWPNGGTDPAFTDTNFRLAYYRLQLQNRSVQFGPPPYANCP